MTIEKMLGRNDVLKNDKKENSFLISSCYD